MVLKFQFTVFLEGVVLCDIILMYHTAFHLRILYSEFIDFDELFLENIGG